MKIQREWIRVAAAAALAAVGLSGHTASGQYAPYGATQPYSAVAPYGVQPNQQAQQPVYPTTLQATYPTTPQAAYPQVQPNQYGQVPAVARAPQYQRPATQSTPYVARQNEPLPTPDPAMNGMNGMNANGTNGGTMNGQTSYDPSYGYQQGGDSSSPYPSTGYYGDASGNCGYNGYYGQDYGVNNYFDSSCGGTQWFGGIYWLYMQRDNPADRRLTVGVDGAPPGGYPYYPLASTNINDLDCNALDHEYRSGVEVRLGSTFTIGGGCNTGCDNGYGAGYSCGSSCPQTYAWEVAWWGIDGDMNAQQVVDDNPVAGMRYYGIVNYAGLEYDDDDDGTYENPVNFYYDYQMPITAPTTNDGDVRILAQRARTNFRASNVELNILRLPMFCDAPCATTGGGYDSRGYGSCAPACSTPAFSVTALCGVRYFRVDDDFESATEWGRYDTGVVPETFDGWGNGANELFHDIEVENHMVGFQLGANMNYCVSCKCNLFWDTNFGLYNNHITHYQRVYNPLDYGVQFAEEARAASARSTKDDIAFLGEMRLGGAYDFTCHWRGVIAYRALAAAGLALSDEQIRPEYSNWANMARIDSNGSMIIHGLQVGVECSY